MEYTDSCCLFAVYRNSTCYPNYHCLPTVQNQKLKRGNSLYYSLAG